MIPEKTRMAFDAHALLELRENSFFTHHTNGISDEIPACLVWFEFDKKCHSLDIIWQFQLIFK